MALIDVILIEAEAVDYRNCKSVCDIDAESDSRHHIGKDDLLISDCCRLPYPCPVSICIKSFDIE